MDYTLLARLSRLLPEEWGGRLPRAVVSVRDLIQVGVNVPVFLWHSSKKEPSESVWAAGRFSPSVPAGTYIVYKFEQRDSFVFRNIILPISCSPEIIHLGTRVWTIAAISFIPTEILIVTRCFHLHSSWSRSPIFVTPVFFVNPIPLDAMGRNSLGLT